MFSKLKNYVAGQLRHPPTLVKLGIVLAVLVFLLCNTSLYIANVNSSDFFGGVNFSNPISEDKPVLIHFSPSYSSLQLIEIPLVKEGTPDAPLQFALRDSNGTVLYAQDFQPSELDTASNLLHVDFGGIKLKKGEDYTVQLQSASLTGGYRLVVVDYTSTDVTGWSWGEQAEEYTPQIDIIFSSLRIKQLAALVCLLLACLPLAVLPEIKNPRANKVLNILVLLFSAGVALCCVEFLNGGVWTYHTPLIALINYAAFLAVYGLLFAATGRLKIALPIANTLFVVFGVVNYFTKQFRGTILLPADLVAAGTALDVLDNYSLHMSWQLVAVLWAWLVLLLIALRKSGHPKISLKKRGIAAGGSLGLAACIGLLVVFPGASAALGFDTSRWGQNELSYRNGISMHFILNISDSIVRKPAGYDAARLELGKASPTQAEQLPHVVLILSESLADYSILGELGTNEDPMPYLHTLAQDENAFVGNFVVSVQGGNTSVTEYQTLTGFSLSLEYSLTSPYYNYINGDVPSLGWYFRDLGYETYATHPMDGSNWNRNGAYPRLGFENIYFIEHYSKNEADMVRNFISDEAVFNKVIECFERRERGAPYFMQAVTVQNHGFYDNKDYEGDILLTEYPGQYPVTEQYLSLTRESDNALRGLLEYFEAQDEPVLVVLYGDHWGPTESEWIQQIWDEERVAALGINEQFLEFTTPVLLWSNYGADFSGIPDTFSANYLPLMLRRAGNFPLTSFDSFLADLVKDYPIVTMGGIQAADGSVYSAEEYAAVDERFITYSKAEYNGMFDTNARRWDLFNATTDETSENG